VQASYTYSKTQGNYPGLVSYDNGQVDPNISSQYDLIELLANRDGKLSQDRPHYIKVDGYYKSTSRRPATSRSARAWPRPVGYAGEHAGAALLVRRRRVVPAAARPARPLRVRARHRPARRLRPASSVAAWRLSVFADLYNVLNQQGEASVDETYALGYAGNNANPVSGGTYEDLIWVKKVDDRGFETTTPIERNPNFHNTAGRYGPFYARIGAQLTF
jgi:hypothetical protein